MRGAFRYNSSLSIINTAAMTARKEMAFNRNEGPVSNASIIKPESAGPINRAVLKLTELSATEFGISSSGTNSGRNEWRTGPSTAEVIPNANAINKTCQS